MNYSKAIRIARSLADMPQRVLAERVDLDPSLISMLESGKRRPSLDTLEKIAGALELPFHLFTLLAAEQDDIKAGNPQELNQLAVGLAKLLLSRSGCEPDSHATRSRETRNSERKSPRRDSEDAKRKTG